MGVTTSTFTEDSVRGGDEDELFGGSPVWDGSRSAEEDERGPPRAGAGGGQAEVHPGVRKRGGLLVAENKSSEPGISMAAWSVTDRSKHLANKTDHSTTSLRSLQQSSSLDAAAPGGAGSPIISVHHPGTTSYSRRSEPRLIPSDDESGGRGAAPPRPRMTQTVRGRTTVMGHWGAGGAMGSRFSPKNAAETKNSDELEELGGDGVGVDDVTKNAMTDMEIMLERERQQELKDLLEKAVVSKNKCFEDKRASKIQLQEADQFRGKNGQISIERFMSASFEQ